MIQVIGAGALNQAVKAVAIARGYVAAGGVELYCIPTFADIRVDGEERTAIRLLVEGHRLVGEQSLPLALDTA
jgi:stage V sporulation protein S